jgi:hypothetical protein
MRARAFRRHPAVSSGPRGALRPGAAAAAWAAAWSAAAVAWAAEGGRAAPGGPAPPEDLLWPTDAGRCVTSTFCEFRSGHFHSGIDVSTGGRTGFRVLAAGDGDVVRIRASCKGYGKAAYLRLRDGRTVVYAHLDRFAGAIEDSARAIGSRTGSAYFDLEVGPGTFPMRRGDVVAFTGETGTGVPHLHVEVRDAAERPLDPLRAGLRVPDRKPPAIRRVALTPLRASASVDGAPDTAILRVAPAKGGARVPRVVPVEGPVGISIEVEDAKDGCRYDLAPSAVGMREDGRPLAEVRYDAFSFDETGGLDFQIDPRFSHAGRGRFQHLFRRTGYDLPFAASGDAGDGTLEGGGDGGEERRTIDLFARDSEGNETVAAIELSFAAPPRVDRLEAGRGADSAGCAPDSLRVEGAARGARGLARVEVDLSTDAGATWLPASAAALDADGAFRAVVPAPEPGCAAVVRARAIDRLGVPGLARSLGLGPAPPEAAPPPVSIATHGPFWEVRLDDVAFAGAAADPSAPHATVRASARGVRVLAPVDGAGDGGAAATLGVFLEDPWGRPVAVRAGAPPAAGPGRTLHVPVPGGRAEGTFLPATVREPAAVLAREVGRAAHAPRELTPLCGLVAFDTGAVPLAGDYEVLLRPERAPGSTERVAVFAQDGDRFRYIGGREDPDRGGWVARVRTSSPLGLFEDVEPPRLGPPSLAPSGEGVRLLFGVRDPGSGLDCDGIEVLLDGRPVPHELDEERGEVRGFPDVGAARDALPAVEIRATDRCGNVACWSGTLRLP